MKIRTMLVLGAIIGCAGRDVAEDTAGADTTRPAPGKSAPAPKPADPAPSGGGGWAVTPFGIGPVRVGMTITEAGNAANGPLTITGDAKTCAYGRADKAPEGVTFMVVDSQVARVDVRGASVATAEGARIGTSAAKIDSLYAGRVTKQPHKYTDGHYLIVGSGAASDTTHRIVFETDGQVVTLYRSGRMPEVGWVEGCS
jgi:hypothetical protein